MSDIIYERGRDALLGLIWGDIVGSFYEFMPPEKIKWQPIERLKTMNNVFRLPFGFYTDDTALTLASMQAFIQSKGDFIPDEHMKETTAYYRDGKYSSTGECFDIGHSTVQAIIRWENGLPQEDWGLGGGGNGFIMRILPYVLWGIVRDRCIYQEMSAMTHADDRTKIIAHIIGVSLDMTITICDPDLDDWDILSHPKGIQQDPSGYSVGTHNIVVETLKKDLGFMGGIEHIIKMGYDTDTNAAIYGMFAGIIYGVDDVDIKSIINMDYILTLYDEFYECLKKPLASNS